MGILDVLGFFSHLSILANLGYSKDQFSASNTLKVVKKKTDVLSLQSLLQSRLGKSVKLLLSSASSH